MTPRTTLLAIFAAAVVSLFSFIARGEPETNKADWWSFKPATRPSLPAASGSGWEINEIDRFIAAKLKSQNLAPSPAADRRTLLRRVTFDLTGLPPTPQELRPFLEDQSAHAYEKVVDRLLASPRHGERWARHWLDTVHYGESHGYDKDKPRPNAWPYRDYVIRSLNADKPYSRFVQEQLAGDVLSPGDPDGIVALGFIAAGPWDFVGHVELPITKSDGLIARYNDRDDMVMNTMSTFQSLTVHCARCHDHKFDAITARDYYGLQAVFAGVDRADRPFDSDSGVARKRGELKARRAALTQEHKDIDAAIARAGGDPLQALDKKIAQAGKSKSSSAAFGYHSQISLTSDVEKWVQVDLGSSRNIERIQFAGCHDDFNNIGAGFGFPLRFRVTISDDPNFGANVLVAADHTASDIPNPGTAPQTVEMAGKSGRYVRFTATRLAPRQNDYIFALAELMVLSANGENYAAGEKVTALDSIEAPDRWQKKNLVDGYYIGMGTNAASGTLAALRSERDALIERMAPKELRSRSASNATVLAGVERELERLPKTALVYAATADFKANGSFIPAGGPRPVHLLRRGEVTKPGLAMKPAAIAAVPASSADFGSVDEGAGRAALAKWITSTNNMLTRRSIVNRVWHYHFGRGIIDTPNDFGHMGGLPSHPELLDWLAFWFLENGESLKKLHRLIVTSATYQQESAARPEASAAKVDSANRLLWRMHSARLDAEQVHDALLAVSGDLDLTIGGPSIQQFGFKDDHSPVYDYSAFDWSAPGANRRSIYRFIVRSVPDPFMDALDCPDPNTPAPVRNTTMTALQALASLNDAFVLRQCERIAARLKRERSAVPEQIDRLYQLALGRSASEVERGKLAAHAGNHGLASVCRVVINSNEFMFID